MILQNAVNENLECRRKSEFGLGSAIFGISDADLVEKRSGIIEIHGFMDFAGLGPTGTFVTLWIYFGFFKKNQTIKFFTF